MGTNVADDLRETAKAALDRMARQRQDRRDVIMRDVVEPEYERVIEAAKKNAALGEFTVIGFLVFDLSDEKRFTLEDNLGGNFLNIALDLLIEKLIKDGFVNVNRLNHSESGMVIGMGW